MQIKSSILKKPQQLSAIFFLSLITSLYVLFIHQLTCHFISSNIMGVLLKCVKWRFNWKALLHFPIIWSKLKADAHTLIRGLISVPENLKSLSLALIFCKLKVILKHLCIFISLSLSSHLLIDLPLIHQGIIDWHYI